MIPVNIAMPPSLRDKLVAAAAQKTLETGRRISFSEFARELIEHGLEAEARGKEDLPP